MKHVAARGKAQLASTPNRARAVTLVHEGARTRTCALLKGALATNVVDDRTFNGLIIQQVWWYALIVTIDDSL